MTQEEVCAVFSTNLKRLMRRDGLKQSDIVARLNVSKAQVSDWCAGKNLPRSNLLGGLTDIFHCKLSELVGDEKAAAPLVNGDTELTAYLEMLRNRPEMRALLDTAIGATKEEVEENVRFIEALRHAKKAD